MEVPYKELSEEALVSIIEEYVSREGTEYGDREYNLNEKVEQVIAQIHRGEVIIEYDPESQSCQLLAAEK